MPALRSLAECSPPRLGYDCHDMTRRELLAAAVAPAFLQAAGRIDRSRISVITDEAARSPADAIAFAKQYGLSKVELRGVPGGRSDYTELSDAELKQAAKEFAGSGITVSFLDAGLYKITLPGTEPVRRRPEAPEEREKRLRRDGVLFERRMEDLRKALNAAHLLGTDKVRVFAFLRVEDPMKMLPRIADILGPMAELAGKERIRLLLENESSCNVGTCAELAEMARLLPSKWFGLNWDSLNGAGFKETPFPDGYERLPKGRLGNIHIKGRSVLDGPEKLDWPAIFAACERDAYKGAFGLETHIFGAGQIQASHDSMKEIMRIVDRG
jgi:L-ribulose-5-phosphate 3-epimerase